MDRAIYRCCRSCQNSCCLQNLHQFFQRDCWQWRQGKHSSIDLIFAFLVRLYSYQGPILKVRGLAPSPRWYCLRLDCELSIYIWFDEACLPYWIWQNIQRDKPFLQWAIWFISSLEPLLWLATPLVSLCNHQFCNSSYLIAGYLLRF